MKAEYKAGRPEDDLIVGKKYDVIDVKCKKGFKVSEIYIKNDKAEERWYSAEHFIMHAEATAAMKMAAVEGALAAGAMATPEPQTNGLMFGAQEGATICSENISIQTGKHRSRRNRRRKFA